MIDPTRPELKVVVSTAERAGLRSIMITGDYRDTATAIASQIGMLTEGGEAVTGAEVDSMSDDELDGRVLHLNTYARSSPQHKMRIVDSLKRRGHIVAMTGDGVNDAPALERASISVAMGITGTDVTKPTHGHYGAGVTRRMSETAGLGHPLHKEKSYARSQPRSPLHQ